jgi:hypothetical protein
VVGTRLVAYFGRRLAFNYNHRLIASEKRLSSGRLDRDQMLVSRSEAHCLAIHVSANALGRALNVMNAMIVTLETEGFPVSVGHGMHETSAHIFGRKIKFAIFEKLGKPKLCS